MGSVIKRGERYYIKWTDATGKRWRKRTAAKTRKAAELLLAELELKTDRQRRGLEAVPVQAQMSFSDLCHWWLKVKCSSNSRDRELSRLERHVMGWPVGDTRLADLRPEILQAHFEVLKLKAELGPASINKLRGTVLAVFKRAKKAGLWGLANPVEEVEREKVPKKPHQTLRAEEVPLVLAQLSEDWLNFFAAAIWLALRKGELCGLLKSDIDWDSMTVCIARSYDFQGTKGGHIDVLPIPAPLEPFLGDACRKSPSQWVFPRSDGRMRTEDCDPQKILRTALSRAGLVDGYEHVCRRCKEPDRHSELQPDATQRRCPKCNMRLWAKPVPRRMVFHDLRHTTATLLIRAGVPLAHVQKIMRHASINTTIGTYGHLAVEDLRQAVEQVAPLSQEQQERLMAVNAGPENLGPNEVQMNNKAETATQQTGETLNVLSELEGGRRGFRTPDPRRVKANPDVGPRTTNSLNGQQPLHGAGSVGSSPTSPKGRVEQQSGPVRVQPLRVVSRETVSLLGVREIAKILQLSTATIYRLVETGALPHVRVMGSIRVSEEDLATYLRTTGGAV